MSSPTSRHQDAVRFLTDKHRYQLEVESGIPSDLLEEEGVYSLLPGDPLPIPDDAFRHPNTNKGQRFPTWPNEITGGIVFPNIDHAGRANYQIRPDTPRSVWDEDGRESRPKYEQCGGVRVSVYVPKRVRPLLDDITISLVITEGNKKVLAAVGALGDRYAVVGLAGVDCFTYKPNPADKTVLGDKGKVRSVPLPDWDTIPLRGRMVLVPFDSDRATNENVQYAEQQLCKMVKARGGIPIVVQLPCKPDGSKMGLDDCVVAGKDLKRILHGAIVARLERTEPLRPSGGDGEQVCRRCEPMIEQAAKHRAESELLAHGPVPIQEAAFYAHLIRRAALARETGRDAVPLYVPKDAETANVSRATATRALNKLRTAGADTLPITITDTWKDGKQHIVMRVPRTIDDEPWSERRAFQAMSRATLAEDRKRQGGSAEAAAARWRCPEHPDDAVVETVTRHYRCAVEDCGRAWSPTPTIIRHRGEHDPIQVEAGDDPVDIYGATFTATVRGDPLQVEAVTTYREDTHQVEAGDRPPSRRSMSGPVSFTSYADQVAAKGPNYWGEAHPDDLAAIRAAAEEAERPKPPPLFVNDVAPDSDRPWYSKRRRPNASDAAGGVM
jgi:hypothetical protein